MKCDRRMFAFLPQPRTGESEHDSADFRCSGKARPPSKEAVRSCPCDRLAVYHPFQAEDIKKGKKG